MSVKNQALNPSESSAHEPVAQAMRQMGRAWHSALAEALEPLRLTVLQWVVLELVIDSPGLSQTAIAKGVGIEGPSLVRVLDELEKDGWLQRKPDAQDRRVKRVFLGDDSTLRIGQAQRCAQSLQARSLSDMSEQEQELMLRLIRKMTTSLRGI